MSRYQIDGGDLAALSSVLARAREKAEQLGKPVRILSCYEAGLDGHWLHRWLIQNGIVNHEIDASSIEVNRRARRAKTDRIDLAQLMRSVPDLPARRAGRLQHGSGSHARGRGSQAAHARARAAGSRSAPRTPTGSTGCCRVRASAMRCR